MNEVASSSNTSTTFIPFFGRSLQSTKMVKKQTKAGKLQASKNKKKVQDALHDTDTTNDEVDSPDLNDKEPNPLDPAGTQEMTPDRPDENTDLEKEKDDDNYPPVSDRILLQTWVPQPA
jgi:hypothetical protein